MNSNSSVLRKLVALCAMACVGAFGFASIAQATARTTLCTGSLENGEEIEVLLAYNSLSFDTPSSIAVSVAGAHLISFPKSTISGQWLATPELAGLVYYYEVAEAGSDLLRLRYPPPLTEDTEIVPVLTLSLPQLNLTVAGLKLSCPL